MKLERSVNMIRETIKKEQVKIVDMNEVDVSTASQPYIGTQALCTCVGLLIYNRFSKIAIVGHLTTEWKYMIDKILEKMLEASFISLEEYEKAEGIHYLYKEFFFSIPNAEDWLKKGLIQKYNLELAPRTPENQLEFLIIPGFYKDNYNIQEELDEFFTSLSPIIVPFKGSISKDDIECSKETTSNQFVFNPQTGKFITKNINFDMLYSENKNK